MDVVRLFTIDTENPGKKKKKTCVSIYLYNKIKNSKFHGEQTHSFFFLFEEGNIETGLSFLILLYPCGEKLTSPAADCVVMLTECVSGVCVYTQLFYTYRELFSRHDCQFKQIVLSFSRISRQTEVIYRSYLCTYLETLSPF